MKKFNWQVFISLNLFFTFIIVAFSGIVLYFKPEGSVARWLDWTFLLLDKSTWESVHTIFSYVFLVFVFFHMIKIHGKNLWNYFTKNRQHTGKEFYYALLISVIFFFGSAFHLSPFHLIFEAGDTLSDSWEQSHSFPEGYISARTSLNEFAEYNAVPVDSLICELNKAGVEDLTSKATFLEIGQANNISPLEAYEIIASADMGLSGDDMGHLSVEEISFILNVSEDYIIETLNNKYECIEITPNTNLNELSQVTGKPVRTIHREIHNITK
ncbi:MAG: DUF4405 domain-containing protein [Bacteroidales bacterium]